MLVRGALWSETPSLKHVGKELVATSGPVTIRHNRVDEFFALKSTVDGPTA